MTSPRNKSILAITIALIAISTVQSQAATTSPAAKPPASFAKYSACLAKAGIKLPAFGGFGGKGTRPTGAPAAGSTPRPRPSLALTAKQQKAFTACAALRPAFNGFGGKAPTSKAPTTKASAPIIPRTGLASYFVCLNAHGLPVKTAAQVAGLDTQNTKVIAAEKACAGK